MTTISPTRNPLDSLMETRRQQEEELNARKAVEAAERQAEREAAEAQRRADAKKQYLIKEVRMFAEGFFLAIAKHATHSEWNVSAIEEAKTYAEFLLRHEDADAPKVTPGIARVVNDKFAYGLALSEHRMPNVMTGIYFVAQRMDWFPSLFAQKQADVQRRRSGK